MAAEFTHDVFLSHNSQDKPSVRQLAERLRASGLRVWFDEWVITAGDDIYLAIERGLQAARVQVLCLSPAALGSDWVAMERSTVLFRDPTNEGRRFIPLLLTTCDLPDTLRRYKYVDYRDESEAAFAELLAACGFAEEPAEVRRRTPASSRPKPHRRHRETRGKTGSVLERTLSDVELEWACSIAVSPDGKWLATAYRTGHIAIWDLVTNSLRMKLNASSHGMNRVVITDDGTQLIFAGNGITIWDLATWSETQHISVAKMVRAVAHLNPRQRLLSGGDDGTLRVRDLAQRSRTRMLQSGRANGDRIFSVEFGRNEDEALTGHFDGTLRLWNLLERKCTALMAGHKSAVYCVRMLPDGRHAVSSSEDATLKIWDLASATCIATLEGHQSHVIDVAISPDGSLLASTGFIDHTIRIWHWRTGACYEVIDAGGEPNNPSPVSIAFTPDGLRLVVGTSGGALLVFRLAEFSASSTEADRRYVNAKIVLVGHSGVGKTALAHRLVEDKSIKTHSTHGMNIWRLDLPLPPEASIEREALLWDLAGQQDYKLIHQIFLRDTALALLLIDPQAEDPFAEAADWVKALRMAAQAAGTSEQISKLLIPARIDVGGLSVSQGKIDHFLNEHGILASLPTSAVRGDNCSDGLNSGRPSALKQLIAESIPWESLPWTSTPRLLAALKNAMLGLSDTSDIRMLRFAELAQRLEAALPGEAFGESDVRTAVRLLANHGLIHPLKFGDLVLLRPELLNGYAAAIVRAARAHREEIGCVTEDEVFAEDFDFSGVDRLRRPDEELLLRALVHMLLDHALCIRERVNGQTLLIFPSQYRRDRAIMSHPNIYVVYTFSGELQTIYTTLVVRLWHGAPFDHKELWRNAAEFKTVKGDTVGFVFERLGDGVGRISVFFDSNVPDELKVLFVEFVHEHLHRHGHDVQRERHYVCTNGHSVTDMDAVRERIAIGRTFIICQRCDKKVPLKDPIENRLGGDAVQNQVAEVDRKALAVLDSQAREQILTGHMMAICGEANQIFREHSRPDYGIDGEVEFRTDTGAASGRKVYVQLKSGPSHLRVRKSDGKEIYDIKDDRHVTYWLSQPVDVFLVIRDKDEVIRWMNISRFLRERTTKKSRQVVFEAERLDFEAVWRLRDVVLERPAA